MIETENNRLYTGITTDVERRFKEHCDAGKKAARFFRTDSAKAIAFTQRCTDRSEASKLEAYIKKLSRKQKILLIQQNQRVELSQN